MTEPSASAPPTPGPGVLSILIPVYNEREYLRTCVERVLAADLPGGLGREVVLVDDGSTDGSREVVEALAAEHPAAVRAFFQPRNQGKGAALRRAMAEMTGRFCLVQDADLEYDPRDYPAVLAPLLEGRADAVYGSRFAGPPGGGPAPRGFHALINRVLTGLSNLATGLRLTDMETATKAFRADLVRCIPLRSDRFGFEPEVTAKVARRGARVAEVSVSYRGRTAAQGKKIGWKDGAAAVWTILKYWILDDSRF